MSGGLSVLTWEALRASQAAGWSPDKSAERLAFEHETAALAHDRAAEERGPLAEMHHGHAATHRKTAESMRKIWKRGRP